MSTALDDLFVKVRAENRAALIAYIPAGFPSKEGCKKVIDAFTGIATRFIDSSPSKEATIVGAANMYVTEFGSPHAVILSRYVRSSVVLCIDPDYWAVNYLDAPFTESLAKTGDGNKKHMVAEYTLTCRNPFASSKVVGCT